MAKSTAKANIIIIPGASISSQSWWPELHAIINEAYASKPNDYSVFPQTWSRLDPDPAKGGKGLTDELGDSGHFAIAFDSDDRPIACGGVLPYRGDNWINEAFEKSDAELANRNVRDTASTDWETCCWCVKPSARGKRLSYQILDALVPFLKAQGGERFYTNYVLNETGDFWPKLGFERVPGVGGMLPKGFQTDPEKEGLRADVHFGLGLRPL